MDRKLSLLVIFLGFFMISASADIIVPTTTTYYFQVNGEPFNDVVEFTVDCYGYTYPPGYDPEKEPGTYTPEVVFTYSVNCPAYGCTDGEGFYLNYKHIDYCNMEGTAGGDAFMLEEYATSPMPTDCDGDYMDMQCSMTIDLPDELGAGTLNPIPGPSASNPPAPVQTSDNSGMIMVGIAVLVIALAALFFLKKKK